MPKLKKLSSILLIDDDKNTNFIHEKFIKRAGINVFVKSFLSARHALDFLNGAVAGSEQYPQPGILFLDLNMPGMNGWEFMEEYKKLPVSITSQIRVFLLTSSIDNADKIQAGKDASIVGFKSKPLTNEILMDVLNEHFEAD